MSAYEAMRLVVSGRVQGVGFRPTVYRLAKELGLSGWVRNTSRGVVIELEGVSKAIRTFVERLPASVPSLALVSGIEEEECSVSGRAGFEILPSQTDASASRALIPFDAAVCPACMTEVGNPDDRRHRYAFTNCTLCGPRYTIIESVPYDRPKTSMKKFPMCPACREEYENPSDRRYHAQPNACPDCGPSLELVDRTGAGQAGDALDQARRLLRNGRVLAVRGVGGFHLAVDATNPSAINSLRKRKRRNRKPFAVLSPSLESIQRFARVSAGEAKLLESERSPIVLLDRVSPFRLAEEVAPGNPRVGAMLPYTPLHHLLCEGFDALVMTSGNLSEEPIARDNHEALDRLGSLADAFLLHDRDILMSCDDSVLFVRGEHPAFVRRSRGYAPDPVPFPECRTGILAVGGHMKNTFCLTRDDEAFLSQHVGDLENMVTYEHFTRCVEHLTGLLGAEPGVIACDLHPDYLSSRYARDIAGTKIEAVQHHHAHLAACMADRELSGEVIGLALDGTGLGDDGTIWGGEVLIGGYGGYERAARIRPFRLPGGDAAVREPWRTAAGLLLEAGGPDLAIQHLANIPEVDGRLAAQVIQAADRNVNSPVTSSLGRLFDGISALLSVCTRAEYDGQAAVELEAVAGQIETSGWELPLVESSGLLDLDHRPLMMNLLAELQGGRPAGELAAAFHQTVIEGLVAVCLDIRRRGGPGRVVLSGGCFMNRRLDKRLDERLSREGFEVFAHRRVPANDGGLSLGQAAVAAWRCAQRGG